MGMKKNQMKMHELKNNKNKLRKNNLKKVLAIMSVGRKVFSE